MFLDGTGGGRQAAEDKLPNVIVRRDLEHIKRNLREKRGKKWYWKSPEVRDKVVAWVMASASFPLNEFHVFWTTVFRALEVNFEEHDALAYLREYVFFINDLELVDAYWRSALDLQCFGFATYVNNVIESDWGRMKQAFLRHPKSQDCGVLIVFIRDLLRGNLEADQYSDIVSKPPLKPSRSFLVGQGEPVKINSYPIEVDGLQRPREFTAEQFYERYKEGTQLEFMREETVSWDKRFPYEVARLVVMPRFRYNVMENEPLLKAWTLVCKATDVAGVEKAFGGSYNFMEHIEAAMKYTCLYITPEYEVVDRQWTFLMRGESPHSLFLRGVYHEEGHLQKPHGLDLNKPAEPAAVTSPKAKRAKTAAELEVLERLQKAARSSAVPRVKEEPASDAEGENAPEDIDPLGMDLGEDEDVNEDDFDGLDDFADELDLAEEELLAEAGIEPRPSGKEMVSKLLEGLTAEAIRQSRAESEAGPLDRYEDGTLFTGGSSSSSGATSSSASGSASSSSEVVCVAPRTVETQPQASSSSRRASIVAAVRREPKMTRKQRRVRDHRARAFQEYQETVVEPHIRAHGSIFQGPPLPAFDMDEDFHDDSDYE